MWFGQLNFTDWVDLTMDELQLVQSICNSKQFIWVQKEIFEWRLAFQIYDALTALLQKH